MRKASNLTIILLGIITVLGLLGFDPQSASYSAFTSPTKATAAKECTGRITRVQSASQFSDALNLRYFEENGRRTIKERKEEPSKEQGLKRTRRVFQLPRTSTAITRETTCRKNLSALDLPWLTRIDMLPLANRPPPAIS